MDEATCQCGCGQQWLIMPGDLGSSISPACQERERKRRLAVEKARRKALRDAARYGESVDHGKTTIHTR
jgi:hypothetical protein